MVVGTTRGRLVIFIILFGSVIFGLMFARAAYRSKYLPREQFIEKKLRVLTYSTFVSSSGPGPTIIESFQAANDCKVEIITAGDAGLLLERLRLAQAGGVPFDVIVGLDQLMLKDAKERFQWKPLELNREGWRAEVNGQKHDEFAPFDWSPLTFVYRQGSVNPPKDFAGLTVTGLRGSFALQDPRSSSPGMQFLNWVKAVKGADSVQFLQDFKPNVQSIAPSWSLSYGLFKKKQSLFAFTYVTSLAFHWGLENDRQYQVLSLAEGHPLQIEYAAVPADCRECDLATAFVKEMLTPEIQKVIMQKNFMLPILKDLEVGTIFAELPKLKIIETSNDKDFSDWDQVFKN